MHVLFYFLSVTHFLYLFLSMRTGLNVAAKIAAIFGLVAVLCGVPAIFSTSFVLTIVLIWLLLFFGGAVLPPATGILMSSVPPEMRALSNSVSMLLYNCLGYFLGPFLPGVVAQVTSASAHRKCGGKRPDFFWFRVLSKN
jgi:MFS family permease